MMRRQPFRHAAFPAASQPLLMAGELARVWQGCSTLLTECFAVLVIGIDNAVHRATYAPALGQLNLCNHQLFCLLKGCLRDCWVLLQQCG